jgi:hypothetical protein
MHVVVQQARHTAAPLELYFCTCGVCLSIPQLFRKPLVLSLPPAFIRFSCSSVQASIVTDLHAQRALSGRLIARLNIYFAGSSDGSEGFHNPCGCVLCPRGASAWRAKEAKDRLLLAARPAVGQAMVTPHKADVHAEASMLATAF